MGFDQIVLLEKRLITLSKEGIKKNYPNQIKAIS